MMKKFFILAMAFAMTCSFNAFAQDPDIEAISAMRKAKADSISMMFGKVYATQAAMNHPASEARATLLKAFDETINLDKQDDDFRDGNTIATEFFKVASDMKGRNGIEMKRSAFAQSLLQRFSDTTTVADMNAEVRAINTEAKRLMDELTALHKDSVAAITEAETIAVKSDSLSQNMGRFYGMQMRVMSQQKKLTPEQITRLIDGFNHGINIDEANKPLVDGRMIGNDFLSMAQNVKKQLKLDLNKDLFASAFTEVLNDPKVPTLDEFKAIDQQTQNYMRETRTFAIENTPEALAQKGLGKKYIENLMEKDPGYIQAPSGLVYKILEPGKGNQFEAKDKIKVMYKGTHVDGSTFDESKEPVTFAPSQVVPGFREALLMMRPGAKMIAVLPQELAYGARGAGQSIKPFETLVFEIETIGIDTEAMAKAEAKPKPKPAIKNTDAKKTVDVKKAEEAPVKAGKTTKAGKKATKKVAKKSKRK